MWTYLLLTLCLSALLASIFLIGIMKVSHQKKWYDTTDARTVHTGNIPRLGGLSFFPVILFACLFCVGIYLLAGNKFSNGFIQVISQISFFICGAILLYLTGLRDDLVGVRYRFKFLVQFIVAALLPASGLWLNNLHGLFGIYALSPWIGIPFTILLVMLIVNAMNFIDGIDGLAGGLSIVSLIVLSVLFISSRLWIYAIISLATMGVLLPFLYYNVYGKAEKQKKIFMGDTGSLTLGYLLSFLCLSLAGNISIVSPLMNKVPFYMVAFSTLFLPMFDVIRVMIVRIAHHKNPFLPDKNHIHHMFLAKGYSVRKSTTAIILIACFYACLNIFCISRGLNINLIVAANLLLWTLFSFWLMKGHKTLSIPTISIPTPAPQEAPQPAHVMHKKRDEKRA